MDEGLPNRDRWLAGAVLLAAGGVSCVPWSPPWTHTLATCVLLGGGGVLVGRGRVPRWFPSTARRALVVPLAVGLPLAAVAALLLVVGLEVPWTPGRGIPLQAALVATLVPVAEEMFFRGALIRAIPGPRIAAIGISSVLFGALHLQLGVVPAVVAAVAGGILCALALGTGSLVVPMAIHLVYNGLATSYREGQPALLACSTLAVLGLAALGAAVRRTT